jgi:signal transduction histidine kinase
MDTIFHIYIIGIILLIIGGIIYLFLRHQRNLKSRAFLMQEAIRNGDYSFRLSTKGLLSGERALQQALNDMENDIGRLVAQHEVESWQRLTRVLTHEIMNATAPISSICQAYLSNPDIQGSPYEEGIRAIRDTSKSLTSFVDSYRKLTQLQEPVIENIPLKDFVEGIKPLYPQIEWHIHIPEDATWSADKNMLHQVFINLTKNAIEAHASAIGQDQVFHLKTGQQLNDLFKIQGRDHGIGHYHDPLALDRLRQYLGALQQTGSYLYRVAAFTQFDLQPFHGRPLMNYIPINLTI